MHQFILIAMFFVTAPVPGTNRVWALQSTQNVEFNSADACKDVMVNILIPAAKSTDTISVIGWCLPKDYVGHERELFRQSGKPRSLEETNRAMAQFGSCYVYVPAPVTGRKRKSPAAGEDGSPRLLGECKTKP